MGEFENVKVGDKVYCTVQWGWSSRKPLLDEVVKVTKSQFTTKSSRYRKEDGKQIGGRSYVQIYDPKKHDPEFKKFNDMIEKKRLVEFVSKECAILNIEELKNIKKMIKEKGE